MNDSNLLTQVDLVFVIDTTGSMGGFINEAKTKLLKILEQAKTSFQLDLQVGLVQYRDHPPQEHTFVTQEIKLTSDLSVVKKEIQALRPVGGGDTPEAVLDGLWAAVQPTLGWREHSLRLLILVGDAPPHRLSRRGQDGVCLCGKDYISTMAAVEEAGCQLLSIAMTPDARESFPLLVELCGGENFVSYYGKDVLSEIEKILTSQFQHLALDEAVYQFKKEQPAATAQDVIDALLLTVSRKEVYQSFARLGRRQLL